MKYIYLAQIEGTEIFKIGFTKKDPKLRIESLQTGNPFKILLIDFYHTSRATKIEAILHRRFQTNKYLPDDYSNLLGEWFMLSNKDVKDFKKTCEQIETNLKIIEENSTLYN